MGLQRYVGELRKQGSESPGDALYGMAFYHAADVDALLARIRAAAGELIRRGEVYRAASCYHYASGDPTHAADERRQEAGYHEAWATLDALLADGGA